MSDKVFVLDVTEVDYNIQGVIHLAVFNKKPALKDIRAVVQDRFRFTDDDFLSVLERGYTSKGMYHMDLVERSVTIVK